MKPALLLASLPLLAACAALPAPQEREAESEERGFGTQSLGLFLGGAEELGDDGRAAGLDYAFWLGPRWSAGAFAEFVTGVERSFAGGVQLGFNPLAEWIVFTGLGYERSEGEWEPIWRVGTSYEFPLADGWFLSPSLAVDFAERDEVFVYGVTVGYSW